MPKGSIDHCADCKVRLKNTKHERTKATLCPDCRGNAHTNYKTKEKVRLYNRNRILKS